MSENDQRQTFLKRIGDIQEQIDGVTKKIDDQENIERCLPMTWIIGIATPFLIWLVLYFTSPSIVQRRDSNRYVRDSGKVFMWTVGATLVVWVGLILYSYCIGNRKVMFCSKS
jgi:hypothetical protein